MGTLNVQQLRNRLGMSTDDLAKALCTTPQEVAIWESEFDPRGIHHDVLLAIERALDAGADPSVLRAKLGLGAEALFYYGLTDPRDPVGQQVPVWMTKQIFCPDWKPPSDLQRAAVKFLDAGAWREEFRKGLGLDDQPTGSTREVEGETSPEAAMRVEHGPAQAGGRSRPATLGAWDADSFERVTGRAPTDDDLERTRCLKAGEVGHQLCGVCAHDWPRFLCQTCTTAVGR
jgi:transcriptional regulator with XRE-family HTH domain